MTETANSLAVVIDANIFIAICSKEETTFEKAQEAFNKYALQGAEFFAPNVMIAEVLFVLCQKADKGILTKAEHEMAVEFFREYLTIISPPSDGEASLVERAEQSRQGYGCSRTADGFYIALVEVLASERSTEFLTFDKGLKTQINNLFPKIVVNKL